MFLGLFNVSVPARGHAVGGEMADELGLKSILSVLLFMSPRFPRRLRQM